MVDYEKAFDSVELSAHFDTLQEEDIDKNYIKFIENMYDNYCNNLTTQDTDKIKIGKEDNFN